MIKNFGYKVVIAVLLLAIAVTFSFSPRGSNTILIATATLDFPNTSAGASSDLTMTLTGAAVGDLVALGAPNGSVPANGVFFAWASAANTVTIRFANNDAVSSFDPASGDYKAGIIKN